MVSGARFRPHPPTGFLESWPSRFFMRSWFDWMAIRFVIQCYFPLSRAWAAGLAAEGSVDLFRSTVGVAGDNLRNIEKILETLAREQRRYLTADAVWRDRFFGAGDISGEILAGIEADRFGASRDLMALRRMFLSIRKLLPQVRWELASPADVQRAHGLRLQVETVAYPAPASVPVEKSHAVQGAKGEEFWIRMPSPMRSTDDWAWARVFMPQERPVRGVVVSLHGVIMEPEMWPLADLSDGLIDRGFCVIRPEAPWHGRRRLQGYFGGEPVFARGILGFIELFEAWVMETALWIRWARETVSQRVAIAGVSLGALTSQIVASVCHRWPIEMRPDGALLITTTGDMMDGALEGSLAKLLGITDHLAEAGWDHAEMDRWRPLVEPGDSPSFDPDRIVMALGDADTVTPFDGGMALSRQWKIPSENLFVGHQGHFSTALGLYRNTAPVDRAAEIFVS